MDRSNARAAMPGSGKSPPLKIEILYYFSNEELDIVEVKILGLAADTPPAEVYHWLCYERSTQQFEKLNFKAMSRDKDWNYRDFLQAKLSFNTQEAHLQWHSNRETENLALNVSDLHSVPAQFVSQIKQFLASRPSP